MRSERRRADSERVAVLRAYVCAVVLVALATAGGVVAHAPDVDMTAAVLALGLAALVSQFFPVVIVRGDGNEDVDSSHAFILGVLLVAGPATAVLVQLVAAVTVNAGRRRPLLKSVFNVAQMTGATAAAGWVYVTIAGAHTMADGFGAPEGAAFLVAALTYQALNEGSVSIVCALADGRPVRGVLVEGRSLTAFNAAVSMTAPVAAAASLTAAWLVPALLVPLWALRRAGAAALAGQREARTDGLTGLPNALALREAIEEADRSLVVALVDLDGFKDINDSLGHQAGDTLIHAVGERLVRETAGRGRVYRLQGDEFVTLLDSDDVEDALHYAAELTEAFTEPFVSAELELDIGLSAGIARAGRSECSTDELLRRADVAMYEAKRNRLGFALYRRDAERDERSRQVISADLRRALRAGEIEVHYQPQYSLADGHLGSVEALVRWRREDGALVGPAAFIPQAERTRVMMPLTVHVLRTSMADCRRWFDDHGYMGRVAINVSARTLHHPSLVADVAAALHESGMDAHRLEIEITESALMVDPEGARRTLVALRALGVAILIDDFGTGYSSLAYLRRLPVDGVKVDRSFVAGMATEHADMVIVQSTLDLAHNLGLRTIAEGVEDATTRDELIALGCDLAQGWLWHPALPAEAIGDVLAAPAASHPAS